METSRENTTPEQVNDISYSPSNEQEAWIGIIYACAAADEYISNTEIDKFTRALSYKKLFDEVDMVELFERVNAVAPELGTEKLLEICAPKISREMRPTLFSIAVELAVSDGHLHGEEEAVIQRLKTALDIDTDLAQKIVDVIHIRFKGNVLVSHEEDEYDDLDED